MPKLLQINVTANEGSTGKIAENIGILAEKNGWESILAYGRDNHNSQLQTIRIGSDFNVLKHGLESRFFDNHGLASRKATLKFVEWAAKYNPDIVHLHNIHGYYINYPILFNWLKEWNGPVVWTLHDCWPFTGHCAHYSHQQCYKWRTKCNKCPQLSSYPASFWMDNSTKNFVKKRMYFSNLAKLHIVTVSDWLKQEVMQSFLGCFDIRTIHNGIDIKTFKSSENKLHHGNRVQILGVANCWDARKGLDDFFCLREILPDKYEIKLVGLSNNQISSLPKGIIGIRRTANVSELVKLYSEADIYINTSVEETLGMTTIEAMACGTPAIVYDSTACSEPIDKRLCQIVPSNDIQALKKAIEIIEDKKNNNSTESLRSWVQAHFDQRICFQKYIDLYNELLNIY